MRYRLAARPRIHELDAVRGFALCGILVVNIWQLTGMRETKAPGVLDQRRQVLSLLFEGRFFPIFSFLFGLSFALFLERAADRTDRPRVVLARRLIALAGFGLIHHIFQPGEALLPYAIVGLMILLPATALPRWVVLLAGLSGTIAVPLLLGGGFGLVPGLFLLGLAAARFDVVPNLNRRSWLVPLIFVVAAPAAVVAGIWQYRTPLLDLGSPAPAIAGLIGALAYLTGLLLLLRTEFGELLSDLLEPLGRMALTNYLSATALVLTAERYLRLHDSTRYGMLLALAAAIILVQTVFSYWWLRWFRYGPLEWIWRCLTWWQLVPNRLTRDERRRLAQRW
ncbi:DUF418 domain-containing protein [Nocardia arthritidis]|uniref:DUF418 domain-containing protein n=1 Tax=Nocardia arthritidis TaxID=228602 RepID=A0A6G9Y8V5_9NOCA|nr:DUF418 domain-containing protein [Nocardia arthritidis]QIS09486.1 DUF418 domain-containing protein [Nocardia arthritidis]